MPRNKTTDGELRTVEQMIRLYCRHKEGNKELCRDCRELLDYARERLCKCPFKENKHTCRQCPVHCYRPEQRRRIREIMRYAGPRMIFYHPGAALLHVIRELKARFCKNNSCLSK